MTVVTRSVDAPISDTVEALLKLHDIEQGRLKDAWGNDPPPYGLSISDDRVTKLARLLYFAADFAQPQLDRLLDHANLIKQACGDGREPDEWCWEHANVVREVALFERVVRGCSLSPDYSICYAGGPETYEPRRRRLAVRHG